MAENARETITITTTNGHTIIANAYLTGRESSDLRATLFAGITVKPGDTPAVPLANTVTHERATLEKLIVSFDGSTDNPIAQFENMPSDEYDEAVVQIKDKTRAFLSPPPPIRPERSKNHKDCFLIFSLKNRLFSFHSNCIPSPRDEKVPGSLGS